MKKTWADLDSVISNLYAEAGMLPAFLSTGEAIIEIIRCVDYWYAHSRYEMSRDNNLHQATVQRYGYLAAGFPKAVSLFLGRANLKEFQPETYLSSQPGINWVTNVLEKCASAGFVIRAMELTRQNVFEIHATERQFKFKSKISKPGLENAVLQDFYWWQIWSSNRSIHTERLKDLSPLVEKEISENITIDDRNSFASFSSPLQEEYYNKLAIVHAEQLVGYDSFTDDSKFNGISFKKIKVVVVSLISRSLRHKDLCILASKKMKSSINLWNFYTSYDTLQQLAKEISLEKSLPFSDVLQVLDLVSLKKSIVSEYSNIAGAALPPLTVFDNGMTVKSIAGCLQNPFSYLVASIKSKLTHDYSVAVNLREKEFKKQLYNLFESSSILTALNSPELKNDRNAMTDVDAILYDKRQSVVLLVQLKWSDDFGSSMRVRHSMANNLYSSSIKWIDRVLQWIEKFGISQLMKQAGIKIDGAKTPEVRLLILGRTSSHFSGKEEDLRATWCTWYRLLRTIAENKNAAINLYDLISDLTSEKIFKRLSPPGFGDELNLGKYKIIFEL